MRSSMLAPTALSQGLRVLGRSLSVARVAFPENSRPGTIV
jgi:hypothetical protein